jgi:hypothetical protein
MSGATVAAIASALIALMALLFSVVSFNRQQTRAAPQQETAEVLAKASVKPLLWIHPQRYLDRKALFLRNYGLGPAIIRSAEFTKEGRPSTHRIVELFDIRLPQDPSRSIVWETFDAVPPRRAIPVEGQITLIRQSLGHLVGQGMDESDGLRLLSLWQEQRRGIRVVIAYEDLLGNEMEPLDFTFQ